LTKTENENVTSKVKVILASACPKSGVILWTLHLRYWRAIHSEFMTHRVFSRNAGSSRAKPVKKVLTQVWNDPAGPEHWGVNQAGMQARAELVGWKRAAAGALWRGAGKVMCGFAWAMMKLGLHKQVANRLLEPWQYIDVLVSATEWDNFFHLRNHEDAQPEFWTLAQLILEAMGDTVKAGCVHERRSGEWHIPYILDSEQSLLLVDRLKLSTARCARVSYEPFDGNASLIKEFERHDLLVGSTPIHASPTEHQARNMGQESRAANFVGWRQYRWFIENDQAV